MKKIVYGMIIALGCLLLLSEVAEASDAQTDYVTGLRYYESKDYNEALKWFLKAVDKGNADAQASLGRMYYRGEGVKKDLRMAVYWVSKAANLGNSDAQFQLGELYYNGNGVAVDRAEAVRWWQKAADQGNEDAIANLRLLRGNNQSNRRRR